MMSFLSTQDTNSKNLIMLVCNLMNHYKDDLMMIDQYLNFICNLIADDDFDFICNVKVSIFTYLDLS